MESLFRATTIRKPCYIPSSRFRCCKLAYTGKEFIEGKTVATLLPNFSISDGKIVLASMRPLEDLELNETLHFRVKTTEWMDWIKENEKSLAAASKSVGILYAVGVTDNPEEPFVYSAGTFIVLKHKSPVASDHTRIAFTTLHVFQPDKYCIDTTNWNVLLSLNDKEISDTIFTRVNAANDKKTDIDQLLLEIRDVAKSLKVDLYPAYISTSAIFRRHEWIRRSISAGVVDGILDPICSLQSMPTLDSAVLYLDKEFPYVEGLEFVDDSALIEGTYAGLVAYHGIEEVFAFGPLDSAKDSEEPWLLDALKDHCVSYQTKTLVKIKAATFLNSGRSVGIVKIIKKGSLICYSGSTSGGSSGGAVIVNGKLAGINLGSFYDYDEADSKIRDPTKPISFDMQHPNENTGLREKKVEKNFNVGINVLHKGITEMTDPAFAVKLISLTPQKKSKDKEGAARRVLSEKK